MVKQILKIITASVFGGSMTGFVINLITVNKTDAAISAIGVMIICIGLRVWFFNE